ncbi:MAG: hypothetical protein R2849_13635 [Thermomicrobiales bacterium]
MTDNDQAVDRDEVRTLARLAGLPMPDERQEQLERTLSAYRANIARLRGVDPGSAEPPTISYESEVPR